MPRGVNTQDEGRIQGRNVVNANSSNIVAPGIVTDGLVLHLDAGNRVSYPTSGTVWYDLTNNRNNGTLTNGPTYSRDNGGSIVFDGSNDYVAITYSLDTNLQSNSFAFWVNFDTFGANTLISGQNINAGHYQIRVRDSGVEILKAGIVSMGTFSNFTPATGTFYNIVVARIANTYYLYANGEYKSSITNTQTFRTSDPVIGKNYNNLEHLDGNLYSVYFYTRTLSAQEVSQNFNATRARFNI